MAKYEERNRRNLEDLLREGKRVDIFRHPKSNKLIAIMDEKNLGIDMRVIELVEEVADADEIFKNEVYKRLAHQCCIAELREIDGQGNPVATGFDVDTGKLIYAEFIPCLLLDNKTKKKAIRLDASLLFDDSQAEKNTNYSYRLKHIDNPSFENVRELSVRFYRELPQELQDELYGALNRGIDILDSEPQMTTYMYCFGKMHQAKLDYAFGKVPDTFFEQSEINIIDYGCGQAIGVMCYADFLRKKGLSQKVKRVTLIEPSIICLKRAALHASVFFPDAEIRIISKEFDELANEDIICDEDVPTLHIFSNVLDMICFDLDKFAELIKANLKGNSQFLCVSPYFRNHERDIRITRFSLHFCDNALGLILDKRELVPDKEWTCVLSVFSVDKLETLSAEVKEEDLTETIEDEYGVKYSQDGKRLLATRIQSDTKNYSIRKGTIVICEKAFYLTKTIFTVLIPNSVKHIGSGAFYLCESLKEIIIPDSVTQIEAGVFVGCKALMQVELSNSIKRIKRGTFSGCKSLQKLVIPSSVESIGNHAFYCCNSLQQIDIPKLVTRIEESTFSYCSSLQHVTIPNGVTIIENAAFSHCYSLQNVVFPNSITSIGEQAFSNCDSLKELTIPKSVNSIGNAAFSGCGSLLQITIPNSLTSIENAVFSSCRSLRQIAIPQTVTSIGSLAFCGCKSLQQITIPDLVKSIEERTFEGCESLELVTINGSIEKIGERAFYGCASLRTIVIHSDVVNSFGRSAFYGCKALKHVEMSDSVVTIGDRVFAGCSSLEKVYLPDSITSIGKDAFYNTLLIEIKAKEEQFRLLSDSGFDTSLYISFEDNHYLKSKDEMTVEEAVSRFGDFSFNKDQNSNSEGEITGVFSKGGKFSIDKRIYADLGTNSDCYFAFYQFLGSVFNEGWYLTKRKVHDSNLISQNFNSTKNLPRRILGNTEFQQVELSDALPMGYINTKKREFDQMLKFIASMKKLSEIGPVKYL